MDPFSANPNGPEPNTLNTTIQHQQNTADPPPLWDRTTHLKPRGSFRPALSSPHMQPICRDSVTPSGRALPEHLNITRPQTVAFFSSSIIAAGSLKAPKAVFPTSQPTRQFLVTTRRCRPPPHSFSFVFPQVFSPDTRLGHSLDTTRGRPPTFPN